MNKNDFWVLSLVVLTLLGALIEWNIFIKLAVIANAILVLWQVGWRVFNAYRRGNTNE